MGNDFSPKKIKSTEKSSHTTVVSLKNWGQEFQTVLFFRQKTAWASICASASSSLPKASWSISGSSNQVLLVPHHKNNNHWKITKIHWKPLKKAFRGRIWRSWYQHRYRTTPTHPRYHTHRFSVGFSHWKKIKSTEKYSQMTEKTSFYKKTFAYLIKIQNFLHKLDFILDCGDILFLAQAIWSTGNEFSP